MRRSLFLLSAAIGASCQRPPEQPPRSSDTTKSQQIIAAVDWQTRRLAVPVRLRLSGWSDENVLWGVYRDRLTRIDVVSGDVRSLPLNAWSVHTARDVVGWRNDTGTWIMREGSTPSRLADLGVDSASGFDGPPSILWSPDGSRAILGWQGEWDAQYKILERDGTLRRVDTKLPGYFGNAAVLWLDTNRVLFQTVASGPVGGAPEYRESGWRGDLAVLDLATGRYQRVTSTPDFTFLRIAGPFGDDVLVSEWDSGGARAHWRYDSRTWDRQRIDLPAGRAFSSKAGAAVMLLDQEGDSSRAVLVSGQTSIPLGIVARDAIPVFSSSGFRGALTTSAGVILIEARR